MSFFRFLILLSAVGVWLSGPCFADAKTIYQFGNEPKSKTFDFNDIDDWLWKQNGKDAKTSSSGAKLSNTHSGKRTYFFTLATGGFLICHDL